MPADLAPRSRASARGSRELTWRDTFTGAGAELQRVLREAPTGVESADAAVDFVVQAPDGHQLHRVPVNLTSRVRGAVQVELWGTGEGGRLSVHVTLRAKSQMTVQLRVTDQPAGAQESLRLLDLIESLVPPNRVSVVVAGHPAGPTAAVRRRMVPETPSGLRALLEDLAFIERALADRIVVPDTFTPDDRADITMTAALLRGDEIPASWSTLRWPMSAAEARELLGGVFADGGEAQFDYETAWQLAVGGSTWDVGLVRVLHESAGVREMEPATLDGVEDEATVVLTLGPRSSPGLRYRLVEVGSGEERQAHDQRWFWDESWQGREREVDVSLAAGNLTTFGSGDEFLAYIDELGTSGR